MNTEVEKDDIFLSCEFSDIEFVEDKDLECVAGGLKLGSMYVEK